MKLYVSLFYVFALSPCSAPSQVHKELWEIIKPQDEALSVIRRLLEWIGEVDLASQRGAPRPAFKASDGGDIFPPAEEQWWLTTFQKKKKPEELAGDEDGPVYYNINLKAEGLGPTGSAEILTLAEWL